jgi:hypothetical protein
VACCRREEVAKFSMWEARTRFRGKTAIAAVVSAMCVGDVAPGREARTKIASKVTCRPAMDCMGRHRDRRRRGVDDRRRPASS